MIGCLVLGKDREETAALWFGMREVEDLCLKDEEEWRKRRMMWEGKKITCT